MRQHSGNNTVVQELINNKLSNKQSKLAASWVNFYQEQTPGQFLSDLLQHTYMRLK